jgi:hypothetical protein
MQRQHTRDDGSNRTHETTRGVSRNVVVARVRDEIVGDDINRPVRYHGRGGRSGDHQRNERSKSDRH